jgi:NADH oxidase (H2O2-forming)
MKYVIIGGGVGGLYTAYYLLKEGIPGDQLHIVTYEWPPYTRHRLGEVLESGSPIDNAYLNIAPHLKREGVKFVVSKAIGLNPSKKEVSIDNGEKISYDELVISTGASPFIPPLKGVSLPNVSTFYDIKALEDLIKIKQSLRVAIIGGGLVGLAAASALKRRGHRVIVLERLPYLLPTVLDEFPARIVSDYLVRRGVYVACGEEVRELISEKKVSYVRTSAGIRGADLVIVATGVRPETRWLESSGIELSRGAIRIDRKARTSLNNVHALGDAALSHDYITGKEVYRPLGFIAAHYAKIVANDIAGNKVASRGIIPTLYERVLDVHIIRIGLSMAEASSLGLSSEVFCDKTADRVECWVKEAGGAKLGYELITKDFVRRNKAWDVYIDIRDSFA